jgi:hypothetical protein
MAAGLPILPVQSFSRPVELDDTRQDARFRTTRLDAAKVPMGRVYFCEHLTPELVWRPEWQEHPNGARAIKRIVVATPDPNRSADLFRGLFGPAAVTPRDGSCAVAAGRARVELRTPQAVAVEFGDASTDPAGRREYLAAVEIGVGSLTETARHLRDIPGMRSEPQRAIVPARAAFNTTLVFSESA